MRRGGQRFAAFLRAVVDTPQGADLEKIQD